MSEILPKIGWLLPLFLVCVLCQSALLNQTVTLEYSSQNAIVVAIIFALNYRKCFRFFVTPISPLSAFENFYFGF